MARLIRLLLLSLTLAFQNVASVKGRTHFAPRNFASEWTKGGAAPSGKFLTFNVIFKPRDVTGLEQRMLDIAHSQSKWLSEDEIASYIAPTAETKARVDTAIRQLKPDSMTYSRNRDTLTVTTTVERAAKFFDAQFYEYRHIRTTEAYYKTHNYTIPTSIDAYISAVDPIATFPHVVRSSHVKSFNEDQSATLSRRDTSTCNVSRTTPACIRALYEFDTYTPTASNSTAPVSVGIMGYLGQNFNQLDLDKYLGIYRINASYLVPVTTIDNATNNDSNPTEEAALDTQTVAGLLYPLRSGYYDLGLVHVTDPFLLTFQYFLGLPVNERPPVITISYHGVESHLTDTQAASTCTAAQQLVAAGMTIVASSGDSGVSGPGECPEFEPLYPSDCPYILSVGGTQDFHPEVMLNQSLSSLYSGAGFSNFFPTPSFQRSVVREYESVLNNADGGHHNKSGRAYPDVSAQGSRQPIIMSGASFLRVCWPVKSLVGGYSSSSGTTSLLLVAGTSASAPIVASGIALLNDLLMKKRNATVGWPHPMFYAHPEAFTDVTSGGSYGCGDTNFGLPAKPGWDASSGLGTLSFSKLRAIYGV